MDKLNEKVKKMHRCRREVDRPNACIAWEVEVTILNRGKTPSPFGDAVGPQPPAIDPLTAPESTPDNSAGILPSQVNYIHVDRLNDCREFRRHLQVPP